MTLESKNTSSTKKKKSNNFDIYLASSSPRRFEILKNLKVNFELLKCDFNEDNFSEEDPQNFVLKNTQQKCLTAQAFRQKSNLSNKPILTADTIVSMDGKIFGKPADKDHAISMLLELSGRKHSVMTCICLGEMDSEKNSNVKMAFDVITTEVTFSNLTANECAKYWATGKKFHAKTSSFIKKYNNKIIVIKYGGYALTKPALLKSFAKNIRKLF